MLVKSQSFGQDLTFERKVRAERSGSFAIVQEGHSLLLSTSSSSKPNSKKSCKSTKSCYVQQNIAYQNKVEPKCSQGTLPQHLRALIVYLLSLCVTDFVSFLTEV